MKPQKKKLWITILLDQLFETVHDVDNAKRGTTSLVRSRAPIPREEFYLRRTNHWRRSKNELWKESFYYRSTFQKVDSFGDCPVKETIRQKMNNPPTAKSGKDQEKAIVQNNTPVRVDIALSTSFLTSPKAAERKQFRRVLGIERGTSTKEKISDGTQTDKQDKPAVKNDVGVGVYLQSAEYSMKNGIISNIMTNKKSFLATKSIKSMNLALWNNKGTQSDPGVRLKLEGKQSKSKDVKLTEEPNQDEKLEEVFHGKNSRKRQVYVKKNQMLGKGSSRGCRMIHPRVSSEMRITQHRIDAMARKRSRVTNSNSQALDDCMRTKKSLESVTKAKVEGLLHSAPSLPREMKSLYQINNRMIPFEVESTFPDETTIDKSLNLFRENCWPDSDVNKFRMETECEILRAHTPPPNADTCVEPVTPTEGATGKPQEAQRRETRVEVVENSTENVVTKGKSDSKDSLHLGRMIMQAIGPQIVKEAQQLSMKEEMSRQGNNPPKVERSSEDVTVQWELEIELQGRGSGNVAAWRRRANENSNNKTLQQESNTHVVLLQPVKSHHKAITDTSSQPSCGSEIEECYLKDETMRKMYRANVPRHLLQATERRLKEIGR